MHVHVVHGGCDPPSVANTAPLFTNAIGVATPRPLAKFGIARSSGIVLSRASIAARTFSAFSLVRRPRRGIVAGGNELLDEFADIGGGERVDREKSGFTSCGFLRETGLDCGDTFMPRGVLGFVRLRPIVRGGMPDGG